MRRRLLAAAILALAACGRQPVEPIRIVQADAQLRDVGGAVVADATATAAGPGIRIAVNVRRLTPGTYGVHVHQVGRCDRPNFAGAGAHWNPTGREHGGLNPDGPHKGDLPNLAVRADGRGSLDFTIPDVSLNRGERRLLDGDGASIVIHALADDYRTDPSGNSGARIACGELD